MGSDYCYFKDDENIQNREWFKLKSYWDAVSQKIGTDVLQTQCLYGEA